MSVEERLARLEQRVEDLRQYVEAQMNHYGFYQRLILVLLGIVVFIIGGKELLAFLFSK